MLALGGEKATLGRHPWAPVDTRQVHGDRAKRRPASKRGVETWAPIVQHAVGDILKACLERSQRKLGAARVPKGSRPWSALEQFRRKSGDGRRHPMLDSCLKGTTHVNRIQ